MFRHLFKMIWNKKKQNFLMITEIFISFLVLFAVFSLLVVNFRIYKKPMGFKYENVWLLSFSMEGNTGDSMKQYYEPVKRLLASMPEVNEISFCSANAPFSMNTSNNSVSYKKAQVTAHTYHTEDSYDEVLQLTMQQGRWFGKEDDGLKYRPVVINQTLKDELFGAEPAIGTLLNPDDEQPMKVIGVVNDFKEKGDYDETGPGIFRRIRTQDSSGYHPDMLLVRLNASEGGAFEARLHKSLSNLMRGANIEIEYLTGKRKAKNNLTLVPIIILLIVSGFLIFNVSLGLFGVLWYNINKRKTEIGLRRAVGASGKKISWQFIAESMLLATIALLAGFFFAVQFPLLNVFDVASGVYMMAILLSAIFIYLLVLICSFYPGKQAAGIYPAVALHED